MTVFFSRSTDSPVLDPKATVGYAARHHEYPRLFCHAAKTLAPIRFGVPWKELNYVGNMEFLQAPTLVFHGGADTLVPLRTSQLLARSRPELVECVTVPGDTHGRTWSMDPDRYDRVSWKFLASVG